MYIKAPKEALRSEKLLLVMVIDAFPFYVWKLKIPPYYYEYTVPIMQFSITASKVPALIYNSPPPLFPLKLY